MVKNKSLYYLFIAITVVIFLSAPCQSFAGSGGGDDSGNGDGSGKGKNKDIVLTLESGSVKNNASNVHLNETFQLNFNKNVCNVTVLAHNKMCFHLTDESGATVPIQLIFPDTQVQRDYKREVFIIPTQDLAPNTQYRISVDSTLSAKNGTYIDNAHTITFTTGTKRTDKENKILKNLGENTIVYETSFSETADSVPINKSDLDSVADDTDSGIGHVAVIAAIALIAIIIIFTVFIIISKRRKE